MTWSERRIGLGFGAVFEKADASRFYSPFVLLILEGFRVSPIL